jgi:hypothetical protein
LLVPALVRADEKQQAGQKESTAPTVVVRVSSFETVVENAKLLAKLFGKEEMGEQFEALIKAKVGAKGLEGIDPRRPIGLYTLISEDLSEAAAVGMVPVADEKALLGLLEDLNFKAEKDKKGVYIIQQDIVPFKIGFRFAHQYAYVTAVNLQALAPKRLIPPSRVFPANVPGLISVTVRLDQVPKTAKDLVLGKMEEKLAEAKEAKEKGETDAQHQARIVMLDAFARQMAVVLKDGRELNAQVDIDVKGQELSVQVSLDAQPDSGLARDIRRLGEEKSLFAGMLIKGAAVNGLVHLLFPEEVKKALAPVIDEGLAQAVKNEPNEAKRAQVEKLVKALAPSLKAGEFDGALSLRGPSAAKRYTLVAGVKLREGKNLEGTLREILKALPEEERDKIKLDADSCKGLSIHRVDATKGFKKEARALFGDSPVYVSFRPDAVLIALGDDGLEALKAAIKAEPGLAAPLVIELSAARLAQSFGKTDKEKKAAREAFPDGEEGRITVTVDGGSSVRLQIRVALSVVRYGGMALQGKRVDEDEN